MKKTILFIRKNYVEIILQFFIHCILFLFYCYSLYYEEEFAVYKFYFFLNYASAAFVINYFLLPRFYYKKRFGVFFLLIAIVITGVILMDEFVLEQIYFPDTRGAYFPGVFFTLAETLPIILIFVGFKFAWDFTKKQSEVDALKNLVKESELQFLKSQINPHFLFNNLNNLYSYSLENSPKAPSIILELSSVLRYMLYDCKEDYVLLTKEIEHLKNFTALNELQIEDRGEVKFSSVHNLSANFKIAPLILNVFIENAFKHSANSQSENIFISIDIKVSEKGELVFICENNFSSIIEEDTFSAKGIGLINVKKRLDLLYPDVHQLKIKATENLYTVVLKMQLKIN